MSQDWFWVDPPMGPLGQRATKEATERNKGRSEAWLMAPAGLEPLMGSPLLALSGTLAPNAAREDCYVMAVRRVGLKAAVANG